MKKVLKHVLIATICTTVGVSIWMYWNNLLFPAKPLEFELEEQVLHSTDMLEPSKMLEDYTYMLKVIESVHPDPFNLTGEEQWEKEKQARFEMIQEPLTAAQFYFALNSLVTQVGDAHTILRFEETDRALPLSFGWVQEGLVIVDDYGPFRQGDLVVRFGGKCPLDLLEELNSLVSAETFYWVRGASIDLLRKRSVLEYLDLVEEERVFFTVERSGIILVGLEAFFEVEMKSRNNLEDLLADRHGWYIEKQENLAVFYLNVCINDEIFSNEVEDFFDAVRSYAIENLAIDLRGNVGGDSRVLDAFMKNLPVGSYKTYGTRINYSKLAADRVGFRRTWGAANFSPSTREVETVAEPFTGALYVLIGNQTFSSGNWIAVVFHDNELADIIGEPTGNAPSSFGDMLTFQLPNTKFILGVSYKYFTRPDPSKDPQDTLYPDVLIEQTRQDVLDNRDPVLEYVRSIISQKES